MRVANTDAAGALGRRVAERLARSGVPQRLIVQGDAVAPDVPGAEGRPRPLLHGGADPLGRRAVHVPARRPVLHVAIARGELDVVADTGPRLTGHPAMSRAEFLRTHPETYDHMKTS